jgi:hypothetical protein
VKLKKKQNNGKKKLKKEDYLLSNVDPQSITSFLLCK